MSRTTWARRAPSTCPTTVTARRATRKGSAALSSSPVPPSKRAASAASPMPALDLFGADLQEFMKRAARGFTRIVAFGEELPNIENRIELVSDKDEFSMPLAKIIHNYDKDAEAVWNANF